MYRLRCDYRYLDSDHKELCANSWNGEHRDCVNAENCKGNAISLACSGHQAVESLCNQSFQSKMSESFVHKVDVIFSYDTLSQKKKSHFSQSKQYTVNAKRSIRSTYRRQLAKESAEALAFLTTCNTELETEMLFLASELEAFRRLERSQRAEIHDLQRYAPQTAPSPSPPSTGPPSPEPHRNKKDKIPDEPGMRLQCASSEIRPACSTPPHALPPPQGDAGNKWRGGAWKKAFRKRP